MSGYKYSNKTFHLWSKYRKEQVQQLRINNYWIQEIRIYRRTKEGKWGTLV